MAKYISTDKKFQSDNPTAIRDYLRKQVGDNPDLSSQTDQELSNRLQNYKDLQTYEPQASPVLDEEKLKNTLTNRLSENGVNSANTGNLVDQIISNIKQGKPVAQSVDGGYAAPAGYSNTGTIDPGSVVGKVLELTQKEYGQGGYFKAQPQYDSDIKAVQDIVNQRAQNAQGNQQITDYLTALPGQLQQGVDQFISGQTDRTIADFNQNAVPTILGNANARGALFSGDAPDLLTQGALTAQSDIDNARADLENQNNQLYFNAAYSNQMRQLLTTGTNLSQSLASERSSVAATQQQNFQAEQNALQRRFQTDIYGRELQRQQTAQQAQYQNQLNLQNRQKNAGLGAGLGSALGATIGAVAGGPAGSVVGSQIGNFAGQQTQEAIG